MAGRHAVGGKTARPGSIRGGQGAHVANGVGTGHNQQTASRPAMRPRPPVLTDQNTSAAVQRMIPRPPTPFANPQGSLNVPAPTNRNFQKAQTAGLPAKGIYGTSKGGYNVTEHSITKPYQTDWAAIGETGPPKGYNPVNNFQGTGTKRQSGMPGTNSKRASGRDNARVRQRPGGF